MAHVYPARTRNPMRGLYLLTPDEPDTARLVSRVEAVLEGAALLQYRNKVADALLRRQQLDALRNVCRHFGVPLVANDDLDAAMDGRADGVHLGRDDGDVARARALLGDAAMIGASCYSDLQRARHAAAAGASYLAFGAFHPSPTKPDAIRAPLDILRQARSFGLPLVAIGGITPGNARALVEAGADLVAVISGVFDSPDPPAAARAYRACFA